jgi:hypothetical protein
MLDHIVQHGHARSKHLWEEGPRNVESHPFSCQENLLLTLKLGLNLPSP